MNPDDATLRLLNLEIAKTPKGHYIWHTVGDSKVRKNHAVLSNTIRAWSHSPDPGEDFGCRCWAESIKISADVASALENAMEKLKDFETSNYSISAKLLRHYLGRTGEPIELKTEELENSPVVKSSILKNQKRFEDSFSGKEGFADYYKPNSLYRSLLTLKDNEVKELLDYWDVDFQKSDLRAIMDSDFVRAIGSGKIRSKGNFQISRKGYMVRITGQINHQLNDLYDFNSDTLIDRNIFKEEKLLADKGYAKPFTVNWAKSQSFEGTITLQKSRIVKQNYKWLETPP